MSVVAVGSSHAALRPTLQGVVERAGKLRLAPDTDQVFGRFDTRSRELSFLQHVHGEFDIKRSFDAGSCGFAISLEPVTISDE